MSELVEKPPFIDRSEQFKTFATSIEQKHIRRHNEKPGTDFFKVNEKKLNITNPENQLRSLTDRIEKTAEFSYI